MSQTRDNDIRAALHNKKLCAYRSSPDTIVVDELGLAHARTRIDIAVINGCIHGFEIKSSLDTLQRLPAQLELYSQCLEKLTLVCAPRHVTAAEKLTPHWCGIILAEKGSRGAVSFETVRRTGTNKGIDRFHLAHLLWRPEALILLSRFDPDHKMAKQPRRELYRELSAMMTVSQLTTSIREFMQLRRAWRGPLAPA
jgi:hypothetical protein